MLNIWLGIYLMLIFIQFVHLYRFQTKISITFVFNEWEVSDMVLL